MDSSDLSFTRNGRVYSFRELLGDRDTLCDQPMSCGLVVGTFAAVPYIHLHLEARRRLYPTIPMLVHDDASPKAPELGRLCSEYGVEFERNNTRLPPCKGDLSVFVGGLLWGKEKELSVVLKLSRRFIPTIDWSKSLLKLADESQYATFCSWTTTFNFGFRSECVGMNVGEWTRLELVNEIAARILAVGEPFVEGYIHNLARRAAAVNCRKAQAYDSNVGARPSDKDGYAVWEYMGTDRRQRSGDYLWHDWADAKDYAGLARAWGLPYELKDFADPNSGFGTR